MVLENENEVHPIFLYNPNTHGYHLRNALCHASNLCPDRVSSLKAGFSGICF